MTQSSGSKPELLMAGQSELKCDDKGEASQDVAYISKRGVET